MLRRAGASTAKKVLWGSAWMWKGASAGLPGGQSSLLGQPLRKYMVRAEPPPPGGPCPVSHTRRPRAWRPPPTPPPAGPESAAAAARGICPLTGPGRAGPGLAWVEDRTDFQAAALLGVGARKTRPSLRRGGMQFNLQKKKTMSPRFSAVPGPFG